MAPKQSDKARKFVTLPKLEEGGFDAWEQAVGHIFYGAGCILTQG